MFHSFLVNVVFYTPWKHQKTYGIKCEHWTEIGKQLKLAREIEVYQIRQACKVVQ